MGDWEGFAGGALTGGCARRYLLAERTRCGRGKAPPTWGRQGLKIIQKTKLIIRNCYLLVKIFNRNLIFSYACVSFLL